jgi:hypothetical protein
MREQPFGFVGTPASRNRHFSVIDSLLADGGCGRSAVRGKRGWTTELLRYFSLNLLRPLP